MGMLVDGPGGRRLTRDGAVEAGMWLYGAAMMCWLFAVLLTPPAAGEEASLAPVWTVFLAWGLGTVPAYGIARLAARRRPVA